MIMMMFCKTLSFLALLGKILDIEIQMPQILKWILKTGYSQQKFSLNLFKETGENPLKFQNIFM